MKSVLKILSRVLFFIISLIVLSEALLRLTVNFLPIELKNLILMNYTLGTGGIYFYDSRYGLNILKPNFTQPRMFYNNYWWHHHANNIGIRDNRDINKADIVVMGDSFLYGHGLEFEETISYQLEKISNHTVANLGVQGDYPVTEYLRLKELGLFLNPKMVLFFINGDQDEGDFLGYKPTLEGVDKLIAETPPDYALGISHSGYLQNYKPSPTLEQFLADSMLARAERLLHKMSAAKESKLSSYLPADNTNLGPIMTNLITDTNVLCRKNGAKLIVIFLVEPRDNNYLNEISKKACLAQNIPFLDLSTDKQLKKDIPMRSRYFLKNDGHFSSEGTRRVAFKIWEFIKRDTLYKK